MLLQDVAKVVEGAQVKRGDSSINGHMGVAVTVTKQLMVGEIPAGDYDGIAATVKPVFESEDAKEGATAFGEKRAPVWKGR